MLGRDSLPSTHVIGCCRQRWFCFRVVVFDRFFERLMIEGFLRNLMIEQTRARVSGRRNRTKDGATHGKTDEERDTRAERRHDEHGAQCDSIRIARGPLCLWRQCSDELRRMTNTINQLNRQAASALAQGERKGDARRTSSAPAPWMRSRSAALSLYWNSADATPTPLT